VTPNKSFLKRINTPVFWAIAIAFVYLAVTLFITIHLMHDSFNTTGTDLGAFIQELKYTLQGKILYSMIVGQSQLALHFSPVLFLLVPIYWLFPHAQTLLVVQGCILAFGGYLVYILARESNYSHRASLIIEGLYFLNPLVWGVALFDFHEVVFAIPALLVMFLGMKRKNWFLFTLGLIIALATKEDVVLTLGVFGAVLIIFDYLRHKKVEKISVIIFCSAILTYGIGIIVSRLVSGGESPALLSYFTIRYAYIGQPLSIAIPLAASTIFSMGSLFLIGAYLTPLAFLPLLSPKWSIPGLIIMLSGIFSTFYYQHNVLMQYPAAAIPFLFMAFLEVLPRIRKNEQIQLLIDKTHKRVVSYALILIVLVSCSIISEGRIQLAAWPDKHDAAINQVIALIPDNSTVSTSNEIFPHLCARTDTYLFAWQAEVPAKYAGITKGDRGYPDRNTEYVVIDTKNNPSNQRYAKNIVKNYTLITEVDGVQLYLLHS
jgi:uncharacterized membrane protein